MDVDSAFDDERSRERLETPWEEYCSLKNAERALEDAESICRTLHEASGINNDILFSFGTEATLTELLPEGE